MNEPSLRYAQPLLRGVLLTQTGEPTALGRAYAISHQKLSCK